jgi:hypothetical protein
MVPNDDWAVGEDGRVAVVRANGYFVEWIMPDGSVITGPVTPFEAIEISRADKEANLEESSSAAGLSIAVMMTSSGGTSMQMSRGGGGMRMGDAPTVDGETWGETFPPFRDRSARVSPANDLWVQRWLPADSPPRMDIFGPDAVRKGSVVIPRGAELLGFGQGPGGENRAYFVRTDEVGLQWLERYLIRWE